MIEKVVIEFMGLPGSGKTTICNALVSRLQFMEKNLSKSRARSYLDLIASVVLILRTKKARRLFFDSHSWFYRERILVFVRWCVRLRRASRPQVIDQGPLQAIWAACEAGAVPKDSVSWLVETLYPFNKINVIVWVDCAPGMAASRLLDRVEHGGNRTLFDGRKECEVAHAFEVASPIYERLAATLARNGAKVVRLCGSEEVLINLEKILDCAKTN